MEEINLKVYQFEYQLKYVEDILSPSILEIYARNLKEATLLATTFFNLPKNSKYELVGKGAYSLKRTNEVKKDDKQKRFNLEGLKKEYELVGLKFEE